MVTGEIATKPNLLKRLAAFMVDYGIIFFYMWTIIQLFGHYDADGKHSVSGFPACSVFLFWFFCTVFAEQFFGTTFGNWIFDLKVLSIKEDNSTNLSLGQSFKRHLVDMLDAFYFVGLILIKNSRYNQRLGDIWAKTIVIDLRDKAQYYRRF